MSILVLDIGTSGVRAAMVDAPARITHELHEEFLPDTPADGLVEFDAAAYAATTLRLARQLLAEAGPAEALGISSQRASTIVWDRATGEPVAPALGWQDLRTLGACLVWQAEGLRFAPNQTATKAAHLCMLADPDGTRDLCIGTPDSWLVWCLTGGALHVTDASNAAVTGLMASDGSGWDARIVERLGLGNRHLPEIVDSSGHLGDATVLAEANGGAPLPICGLAGDQQASLIGQGAVRAGLAKITFGTGGMLDVCLGESRPTPMDRATHGTFPIVCWQRDGRRIWGLEAIMLSAGTNVQWLRDDLGIIGSSEQSEAVAAACETSEGVVYVPAQMGLGTPHWDYGARGALFGLTRGSNRHHITRAVLEGIAQRGADLVEAAEADAGITIDTLRVDGGMSANAVFVQALADVTGRRVEVSPVRDATAVGAALLAGLAIGTWTDWAEVEATWLPLAAVEPRADFDRAGARAQWARAVDRSKEWFAELSALDF